MKKHIDVDGIDRAVVLVRRKGTRTLKITLKNDGSVRLSVPYGIPESVAHRYLRSKADWIHANSKQAHIVQNGAHIGKSAVLSVEHADISRPSTKVSAMGIRVRLPHDIDAHAPEGQAVIKKACDKSLLLQAERLLPQRLADMSRTHDIPYTSITIKKLTSRWGSCDSHNNIVLNSYLIQFDWRLIDYVICHELAHTVWHDHSSDFWQLVQTMIPDYKDRRSELKDKPTNVIAT